MAEHEYTLAEGNAGDATGFGTIVDTALASAEPKILAEDQLAAIVVPHAGRVEIVDITERLAKHNAAPSRATGTHTAATVKSFMEFVERHRSENLTIWVHPTSGAIAAVLNDHGAAQAAAWGDHRVALKLEQTEEWKRWRGNDGKLLDQQTFAEHIEDGLTEIAEPAGADLLEIAQTMHGTTEAAWKAGVRLTDGAVKFSYVEDATAKAGADGELEIPKDFVLLMAVFVGEPPVQVDAHLRWRARGGELKIGYKLDNPERIVQQVLQTIADRIGEQFTGSVFLGEPRRS